MSNTFKWIPFQSVAPIVLLNDAYPDYPFFSGSGFFVEFSPYDSIFFVTARHCIFNEDNSLKGDIQISWHTSQNLSEPVPFSKCMIAKTKNSSGFFEDICVFVVGSIASEKAQFLKNRSLKIQHQENVDLLLQHIEHAKENLRIVGFPSCSKEIDYDSQKSWATPRGIYGKIVVGSLRDDEYEMSDLNWRGGELDGFSGSPVLALCRDLSGNVVAVPVGIVVRGSSKKFTAININVVTNLIASWLRGEAIDLS